MAKENLKNTFKFDKIIIEDNNKKTLSHVQNLHLNTKKLLKILTDKFKEINFAGFELVIFYDSINKNEGNKLKTGKNTNMIEKLNFDEGNNRINKNLEENLFIIKIEFPIKNDNSLENAINSKLIAIKNKINI